MEAERVADGLAIHYSMPSVHAAGVLGQHARKDDEDALVPHQRDFPGARDGWVRALQDLGYSPDFVASEQVETDGLRGRRVFVLPYSLALSEKEAAALQAFVEAGGVLLADGPAGLFDEHLNWRTAGALDELFGIAGAAPEARARAVARGKGPVAVTAEGRAWGLDGRRLPGLLALEPRLALTSGKPLLRIGTTDAVVVRRVGQGWAVYLNHLLDRYAGVRGRPDGEAYCAVLEAVLAHAGVRPAVSVTDAAGRPLRRALVSRYRFDETDVVAVLDGDEDAATRYGVDGVTRYTGPAAAASGPGRDVVVRLPRAGVVANARTGESYGRTEKVSTRLVPGEALVLAASPSPGDLAVSGAATASLGAHPSFELRPGPGRHLVRVQVHGPDGHFRPEYSRNLLVVGGVGRFVLPAALDDPAGEYRIVAADVLTGARAEARVTFR